MENKSNNEVKIAFSGAESFKKAITVDEFEIILFLAEERNSKINEIINDRNELVSKIKEKLEEVESRIPLEDFSKAVKSAKAMIFTADKEMYKVFKNELDNYSSLVSFLNKFRKPNELHKELDLKFLNKLKQ